MFHRRTVDGDYRTISGRLHRRCQRQSITLFQFTGISPAFHHIDMMPRESPSAMKEDNITENIVIPIKIERVKLWTRWTLETTTWLICLGLLAASAAVAACASLVWLISGSEIVLTLGFGSGLLLGLAGVWHLLRRLDQTVKQLRSETPSAS
jgi:uncharacterized membrane protein